MTRIETDAEYLRRAERDHSIRAGLTLGALLGFVMGVLVSVALALLLLACSAPVPPTPREAADTETPFAAVRPVQPPLGAPEGSERPATARPDETLGQRVSGGRLPAGSPRQPPRSTGGVTPAPGAPTRSGVWAYAKPSHGPLYLAIPEGPGWIVHVCGPLTCIERVSTDAGPELWLQKPPHSRIGDLAAVMFREVCGPLSAGLCRGSYAILGAADQHPDDPPADPRDDEMRAEDGPKPTVPPTSTEGAP